MMSISLWVSTTEFEKETALYLFLSKTVGWFTTSMIPFQTYFAQMEEYQLSDVSFMIAT